MFKAVIDAGYNSFRLVIYQIFPNHTFRIHSSLKFFVRIGEGITEGGKIREDRVKEAERAFSIYRKILENKKIEDVKIVATSAFRYASNGKEVAERLEKAINNKIEIISGEEEGRYSATGMLNTLPINDAILFELGGGSLELIEVENRKVNKVFQLPIGALKLLHNDVKEIRKIVNDALSTVNVKKFSTLIGSGGNIRALAKMDSKLSSYPLKSIHGYSISLSSIEKYSSLLPSLDIDARASIPGISKDRALTIHTASIIVNELMKYFNANTLIVSAYGMREGVATEGFTLTRDDWLDAIAYYHALEPPKEIMIDAMNFFDGKLSYFVASASYLSLVFKQAGYLNPFEACYRFMKNAVLPGFTLEEAYLISLICKSAHRKVKKKQLKFLKQIDVHKKEINSLGNIVKNLVDKYVDGVKI
ncbi:Ppx/GppA phosphatase family protein [Sulfurisphaera javensis]|uniref:Ppx/GppA phosphatase family protein n=1 Tax=Sulfurisphaera javensis TaxID=2049879 RepID=A0AAT9GUS7_9CREN